MRCHELEAQPQAATRVLRQVDEEEEEKPESTGLISRQCDPLAQLAARTRSKPDSDAQIAALRRSIASQPSVAAGSLLRLQRTYGNRYTQRLIARAAQGNEVTEVAPEVEEAIQRARGGGQALDSAARAQMEPAFGADFSGVRVHTGGQADALNRSLSARAFTTGQDIFFKQGEYSPGSTSGRKLIAHELTHVVQQNGEWVQTKLILGLPGDRYEQEADQVARTVTQYPTQKNAGEGLVQCQDEEEDEEKKPIQAKLNGAAVQQQAEEEEKKEEVAQAQVIQRSLADAFDKFSDSCECGEALGHDCAHFLSDALIKAGYNDLDGGKGALKRRRKGRTVCKSGRPVRAGELRDWFAGQATGTSKTEPDDKQYWAVYQHNGYPGGHVVIHHHNGKKYTWAGTGDYPDWATQEHYTW